MNLQAQLDAGTESRILQVTEAERLRTDPLHVSPKQWLGAIPGDVLKEDLAVGADRVEGVLLPLDEFFDRNLFDMAKPRKKVDQLPIGVDPVALVNRLDDAYPNPFNPSTTIRYSIKNRGQVTLTIYNAAGQLVRTLVNEVQTPRTSGFDVVWDGTSNAGQAVSSGVYFYKLSAIGFVQTKKMVLLK